MKFIPTNALKINSPMKTYLLLSLYFIGFGILVAILTSFINYQMQVTNVDKALEERFERVIEAKLEYIKASMDSLDATLDSITTSETTHRYIRNPNKMNLESLQELFIATTTAGPEYMQVRLLSEEGMELIRVGRLSNKSVTLTPEGKLQDKSNRYYFQEVAALQPSSYWYSNLDLNIENGEIEIPIKPTLRVATPIEMKSGKMGVVIINVNVEAILESLSLTPDFTIYLEDSSGNVLYHPEPNKSWSQYLPNREPIAHKNEDIPVYRFSLNEWIDNGEGIQLVMTPKQHMLDQIAKSNLLTAFVIAGIVLLISFPLSWVVALLPANLQRQLSAALGALQRTDNLLNHHVISSHTDINGTITQVSKRMAYISGYKQSELIGKKHNVLRHPDSDPNNAKLLWQAISKGGTWKGEFHNQTKDGDSYWLSSIITPEIDDESNIIGYMQIAQVITSTKLLEAASITDTLTQINNRYQLDQVLTGELNRCNRYGGKFSVLLLDLDYFKRVNDTYGHLAGDQTLIEVAKALQNTIRKTDIVGRWGGEEFLIICPETALSGALFLGNNLRKTIQQITFPDREPITASVGVACLRDGESINGLIARADEALYLSKANGRDRVIASKD